MITVADLRKVAGKAARKDILDAIVEMAPIVLPRYDITSPQRMRMFFAQMAHESDGFKTTEEYASGAAYEGRDDLGNVKRGDGKRYKGRGLFQLTGRANYQKFGDRMGINLVEQPALAASPKLSFEIAAEYWRLKKLNVLADKGDFVGVTRKINGGTNGLADRKVWLAKFTALFPDKAVHLIEDTDEEEAPLNVQPERETPTIDVETIQRKLDRLGYHEVGEPNGRWGGKTAAAIAAFKNDRGMEGAPVIDAALKSEIDRCLLDGWTRPISEERANITEKEIAPSAPAVQQTLRQRFWALWGGICSIFAAAFNAISNSFNSVKDHVQPFMDFFTDVPAWMWFVGITAACVLIYVSANSATHSIVEAKRTGRLN